MTVDADDRAALSELAHRYAAAVDDRQFGSVVQLFTADAELWLPDPPASLEPLRRHHGHSAIEDAVAAVASSTMRTQHAIFSEVYDAGPRPDSARGRIAGLAHHWIDRDGEVRDAVWHLRYDDEYHREHSGAWRIHRRALTIDAIDTRTPKRVRPRSE